VNDFAQSAQTAIGLIVHADAALLHTVLLSLGVRVQPACSRPVSGWWPAPGSRSRVSRATARS